MIMGHFGHTYLPISNVFYTMPITLVLFLLRHLPTTKSGVLYERSLSLICVMLCFLEESDVYLEVLLHYSDMPNLSI